jgi:hypothetical protein
MDKSDELRLLPLSVSWYHADVVRAIDPLLDEGVPADVVCSSLSALQLKKYADSSDTASGIAVFLLKRVENSADAKSAHANVTKVVQQTQEVLNLFLSDEECMLAFLAQFVSGVSGELDYMTLPFHMYVVI